MKRRIMFAVVFFNCVLAFAQETGNKEVPALQNAPLYVGLKIQLPVLPKAPADLTTSLEILQGSGLVDDAQRTKLFSKSFALSRNDKVNLSNIFGSIVIKTWDKNEIKVDAEIKAFANSDKEVDKLIENVSINAVKNGEMVMVKTQMTNGDGARGVGFRNGKRWRKEVKVMMVVYMPESNALTAAQQYGSLSLENFSGPTSLKVQYGNLTAGRLINSNNYVSVQYGKVNLEGVKNAKVRVQYGGGLVIGDAEDIDVEAQYTTINISSIKNKAIIKTQYGGGVTLGSVGSLSLAAQYATINIERLLGAFTGKLQYGKLNIARIDAGNAVNIDADYTPVNLGFSPNFGAVFNVNTTYGNFKHDDNVSSRKVGDDKSSSSVREYRGTIGGGGTSSVRVTSRYGSVNFN